MIKAIVTDFGRVLLFPKDENYTGLLNDLHERQLADDDYDFWSYFKVNDELLNFYRRLSDKFDVYIFTTRHIQEYPPVAEKIKGVFKGIISAARIDVDKETPGAYITMSKEIGLLPEEIVFVDDTKEKLDAAKEAGMVAIAYNANDQVIKEIQRAIS